MSGLTDILRNGAGEMEWTRTMGAAAVIIYIVMTHVFEAYQIFWIKKDFDLVSYCTAFPGGLIVLIGGVATAAGFKDRNVAQASVTCAQAQQASS